MRVVLKAGFVALALSPAWLACGDSKTSSTQPPAITPPVPHSEGPTMSNANLNATPDQFLAEGPPTLVVGTLGDADSDLAVTAQAELVRAVIPGSVIVEDTSIAVEMGRDGWPARPMLFGNEKVNAVVAALSEELPFRIDEHRLRIGGEEYAEFGARLIAAVPAGTRHPAFVIYAGVGLPGIVDINATPHGGDPILIADAHGSLRTGRWTPGTEGTLGVEFGTSATRIPWRDVERSVGGLSLLVRFPAQLPEQPEEREIADAVARGYERAAKKLQLKTVSALPVLQVFVWPDHRSKISNTGIAGDGHAIAISATIHVVRFDPKPGGALEWLMAHEATHVLTGLLWGPAATPLMGEGVAVWTSGRYGGRELAEFASAAGPRTAPSTLLDPRAFRGIPEGEAYPTAGRLVEAAIARIGLDGVRDFLYRASALTWIDACKAAGISAEVLDRDVVGSP